MDPNLITLCTSLYGVYVRLFSVFESYNMNKFPCRKTTNTANRGGGIMQMIVKADAVSKNQIYIMKVRAEMEGT